MSHHRYAEAYVDYKHVISLDTSADQAHQGATRYGFYFVCFVILQQRTTRLEHFLLVCDVPSSTLFQHLLDAQAHFLSCLCCFHALCSLLSKMFVLIFFFVPLSRGRNVTVCHHNLIP